MNPLDRRIAELKGGAGPLRDLAPKRLALDPIHEVERFWIEGSGEKAPPGLSSLDWEHQCTVAADPCKPLSLDAMYRAAQSLGLIDPDRFMPREVIDLGEAQVVEPLALPPIKVDLTLPPGTIEVRYEERVVGRIVNTKEEKN